MVTIVVFAGSTRREAEPPSCLVDQHTFGGIRVRHPRFLAKFESSARRRRHELLLRMISSLETSPSILDVGGTATYWKSFNFPADMVRRIVLLNTFPQVVDQQFESVVGDARDLSRFRDCEFDIVFSNSVIGHVGDFEDQEQMAREIRRVGIHFFVQTPNHGFPLDWRTLVPGFHFLPVKAQAWCFLHMRVGTYRRAGNLAEAFEWATRIRNLRRRELDLLFPGAFVVDERALGLTKSFMVHNFPMQVDG